MDIPLATKRCVPCEGGTPPLSQVQARMLHAELPSGWALGDTTLKKTFRFAGFREAIDFVTAVAELAEAEGHHPDIDIRYQAVQITLTTHAINGLSENDFIVAAKIDPLA